MLSQNAFIMDCISHLYDTNAKEIKIRNSTKLLEQILRYKIPYCVLQIKTYNPIIIIIALIKTH